MTQWLGDSVSQLSLAWPCMALPSTVDWQVFWCRWSMTWWSWAENRCPSWRTTTLPWQRGLATRATRQHCKADEETWRDTGERQVRDRCHYITCHHVCFDIFDLSFSDVTNLASSQALTPFPNQCECCHDHHPSDQESKGSKAINLAEWLQQSYV